MIRTNLAGVANVETTTQERFAELFRQWSAAVLVGGTQLAAKVELRRIDPRRPLGGRLLCGPRFEEAALGGGHQEMKLAGTSVAYVLLHSPASDHSRVSVTTEPAADLQVSLFRLPEQTGRLSLRCERGSGTGSLQLVLTAHDGAVRLEEAAWERLVPNGNHPEDTSYRTAQPPGQTVRAWFGDPYLKAEKTRTSVAIPLPQLDGPGILVIFKVAATDTAGHRLAAWAVYPGKW